MKENILTLAVGIILIGLSFLFIPSQASAHEPSVSIGINLGPPPPPVIVSGPPALYMIPGSPVYYVPQYRREIFYYSNNWYRMYNGYFYRTSYYGGPWLFVPPASVPSVFIDLSPDYFIMPPREIYVPYWKNRVYYREREHYYYRDRYDGHDRYDRYDRDDDHDRGRDWKHDGWKDWKEDKWDKKDYKRKYRT